MLAIAIILSFAVNAQTTSQGIPKSAGGWLADTLINAGTSYLTVSPIPLNGNYNYCSISATMTNISGTTAATVTLEHSADGINFYATPVDSVLTFAAAGSKGIIWTGYRDKAFRLKFVGTGTQHSQIKSYYSLKQ